MGWPFSLKPAKIGICRMRSTSALRMRCYGLVYDKLTALDFAFSFSYADSGRDNVTDECSHSYMCSNKARLSDSNIYCILVLPFSN